MVDLFRMRALQKKFQTRSDTAGVDECSCLKQM